MPVAATVCLTDDQIQAEIQAYVDDNSLPTGPTTEYFLYTAPGVGSCSDSSHCW